MGWKLKRFLYTFLILFSFGTISIYANNTLNDVSIQIDGTYLELSDSPKIIDGNTLVPIQDISAILNIPINWNENTNTIDIYGKENTYTLEINNNVVKCENNDTIILNTAPTIINNKTFVPIRFIAESMGTDVLWDDFSRTIFITTRKELQNNNLEKIELSLGNKKVYTGELVSMLKKDFGEPSRIEKSIYNLDWYIYNHDYKQFIMVAVKDNIVVGYYTNAKGFILNDKIQYDMIYSDDNIDSQITIYKDSNNNEKIYGVLVVLLPYQNEEIISSPEFLNIQAKENFDILNTFRTNYNLPILEWDNLLVESSELHCIDMAEKGYFSHNSLDGRTHKDRILTTGIKDTVAWGENIVAGPKLAIDMFDLWINSSGHRTNMLRENFTHVGIASIYKENSIYSYYSGQNFVEKNAEKVNETDKESNGHTITFTIY
ncbi:stalk domain-containing protein [Lachnospiraceae bacterium 46-61]